ncbi:hypothetical protein H6A03_10285 [[Clostridium] spiroforme]|nr:hypothetical protein [Thomasclavelia spiroformis]
MEIKLKDLKINSERLDKSRLKFCKNTKKKPIFHYTSIAGLEGILKSKKLRFTNIKYMNDKDEIIAGIDSFVKTFKVSEEIKEQLYKGFNDDGIQRFVCCFSLEQDSLPLWNYYTKDINNNGYNIEFDHKKLVESILRDNLCLDGCNLSYGIVEYSRHNDSKYNTMLRDDNVKACNLLLSDFFLKIHEMLLIDQPSNKKEVALQDLIKKIFGIEDNKKFNNYPVYFYNGEECCFENGFSFDSLFLFTKRDCFKQEKEFRIVITVPDERLKVLKKNEIYKFRVGNGIMIPFLELNFSTDVVKSITISPTIQSDLVELSIQDFLKYCEIKKENYSEFIKHSKVPVRF